MPRGKPHKTKYPRVYKRETNKGRVYDFYVTVDGKQDWTRGKHSNLEQAEHHRRDLQYKADHGILPSEKPRTLRAFAIDDWLPHQRARVERENLQDSTLRQYEHDLARHITAELGDERLDRIDLGRLQRFQDDLTIRGYSAHTIRRIVNTTSSVLELARRRNLILVNHARDLEKPEARARRKPILLTVPQLYELADKAPSGDERRLILLAAFTGLREGELYALRLSSVRTEPEKEGLLVTERYYQGKVRPRTKNGEPRWTPLDPTAAAILREQLREGRSSALELVFPAPEGGYWNGSNFDSRIWIPLRDAAGFPDLHFHDLRHFYVTQIRNHSGLPSDITKRYAGHLSAASHDHYTHATAAVDTLYRDALGPVFARPQRKEQR